MHDPPFVMQGCKPKGAKAPTRGLLIGSYRQPAAAQAADSHAASDTCQPLSAMASRPSTVMSANYRYASTLATEASSSCSEPESAAESAAELNQPESQMSQPETKAACLSRQTLVGKETARHHANRHGSVGRTAGSDVQRAESVSQRAGLLKRKAGSDAAKGPSPCLGLQAQLREQHPFKLLTAPLQSHTTSHKGQLQSRRSTAALQRQDGSSVQAAQQQTKSILEEESQLVASLRRLDHELGCANMQLHNKSVSAGVMQPTCPSELQWEATNNTTAPMQAISDRLLNSAPHSRLHALHDAKPAPAKPGMTNNHQRQQLRPFGRAFAPGLGANAMGPETAISPLRRTCAAAAADGAPCPLARPVPKGSNMRAKGRTKAKGKGQNQSPDGKHAAAVAVGRDSGDMSNSAEQQLLQSSLARLDARLSSLTAKPGGKSKNRLCCLTAPKVAIALCASPQNEASSPEHVPCRICHAEAWV